jgi:hypothetical protein
MSLDLSDAMPLTRGATVCMHWCLYPRPWRLSTRYSRYQRTPSTGLHRVMAKSTAAAEHASISPQPCASKFLSTPSLAMYQRRQHPRGLLTCNHPHRDVWSGDPNDEHRTRRGASKKRLTRCTHSAARSAASNQTASSARRIKETGHLCSSRGLGKGI